jgi:hypothetical protein
VGRQTVRRLSRSARELGAKAFRPRQQAAAGGLGQRRQRRRATTATQAPSPLRRNRADDRAVDARRVAPRPPRDPTHQPRIRPRPYPAAGVSAQTNPNQRVGPATASQGPTRSHARSHRRQECRQLLGHLQPLELVSELAQSLPHRSDEPLCASTADGIGIRPRLASLERTGDVGSAGGPARRVLEDVCWLVDALSHLSHQAVV